MITLTNFRYKEKKKKKDPSVLGGIGKVGTGLYVGQAATRAALPRILGVRLESHSTSKDRAREILKNGGILDPKYGGTGESLINDEWNKNSKGFVHITGQSKKYSYVPAMGRMTTEISPLEAAVHKAGQRKYYRASSAFDKEAIKKLTSGDMKNPKDIAKTLGSYIKGNVQGALGVKGKTLYIGGTDKYFDRNFIPDPDDLALKTNKKIKVYGNRLKAINATLDKYGKGNKLKGAVKLIKANPKRSLAGLGILALGSTIAALKTKEGINEIRKSKRDVRDDKGQKRGSYKLI